MTDETIDPNEKSKSISERFLKPKNQRKENPLFTQGIIPVEDRKRAMQTLTLTEIRVGYIAAAYAAFIAGLATVLFPKNSYVSVKAVNGHCVAPYALRAGEHTTCWALASNNLVLLAIVTLIFAAAIAISVKLRKRVLTTFSALITGVAFFGNKNFGIAIAAPFLIYGGWLFLRARRIQKYGTTDAKDVATLAGEERAARRSGAPASPRPTRAERSAKTQKDAPTTSPRANVTKRYTPPAPKKKKPVPPPVEKPSKWRARLEGTSEDTDS